MFKFCFKQAGKEKAAEESGGFLIANSTSASVQREAVGLSCLDYSGLKQRCQTWFFALVCGLSGRMVEVFMAASGGGDALRG